MELKYALVHEWFTPLATGGSELVVKEILNHIDADLYATIDFESVNPESYLYQRKIGTTFIQNLPFVRKGPQKYLPLLPVAIENLDLRNYDVILSSSHTVAKGVLSSPQQLHICYCHSPMRYAWDLTFDYLNNNTSVIPDIKNILARYFLHQLRQWDAIAANRVDYYIANSQHIAQRIWRCYRRSAKVIYPPVNLDRFSVEEQKEDYYLTVSRLVTYKKVSLIVRAFNQLGKPLVIIGDGPEMAKIRQLAKPNIQILGAQPDEIVEQYMKKAKAFVYAACEDFGIAIVEAQACGTPAIAYKGGGAKETVKDIREDPAKGTGLLFFPQKPAALIEAVNTFCQLQDRFLPENCRLQAEKFAPEVFKRSYLDFIDQCYRDWTGIDRLQNEDNADLN
ncbi:MAG: glycosyltransferase [Prochloraceae cyanobacterium]|nr:glycosyltransferase [Prochloraceae cyanobacterium]